VRSGAPIPCPFGLQRAAWTFCWRIGISLVVPS
jgi:hypothetical protein